MSKPVPKLSTEVRLASRPSGWPVEENFAVVEVPVARPGPGQILVRNEVMSVDPYMRGRMNAGASYVPPYPVNEALTGAAAGEVIISESPAFEPGQKVVHSLGWREYAVVDAAAATAVSTADVPLAAYLGVLGGTGFSAYVGLIDHAAFRSRDTVFVSGAAGAVGSLVGQIAKLRGAPRVIGSAGSAEKVRYLKDTLGFDAAFNYRDGPVAEQLATAAPEGIDVYFDNVGGDHLEAAIGALNTGGRIAACGAIAQYNAVDPQPGPRNMFLVVTKRLRMQGFIVSDSADRRPDFLREVGTWLRDGRIQDPRTTVDGLRKAPAAFLGMLRGENIGKMLVTV